MTPRQSPRRIRKAKVDGFTAERLPRLQIKIHECSSALFSNPLSIFSTANKFSMMYPHIEIRRGDSIDLLLSYAFAQQACLISLRRP